MRASLHRPPCAALLLCCVLPCAAAAQAGRGAWRQQAPLPRIGPTVEGQPWDHVPLRPGLYEEMLLRGKGAGVPSQDAVNCPGTTHTPTFPTPLPPYGRQVMTEILSFADGVRALPKGRYLAYGGMRTTRAGDVGWEHRLTLDGDAAYRDAITVTTHAETRPVRRFGRGAGHWTAPCPAGPK